MPDAIETALARMDIVRQLAQSGVPDVLLGIGHAGNGRIRITIWPDDEDFRVAVAQHLPADSYDFNVMPLEAGLA
ncbi:MAG: hypothetical protein JO079_13505 [Frankiaceae bacterium]|nr:hypothetical protein [Frankiaceae bacterium]MBV9369133.1 hypothetical protein [Frankiales bacterium]